MQRLPVLAASLLALALLGSADTTQGATEEATPPTGVCVAPALPPGTPTPPRAQVTPAASPPAQGAAAPASLETGDATAADEATAARVLAGIENFVSCRNAGDYAAYAALLTPNRILIEAGTTNPYDVVSDLQGFNLPITTLSLGDVRTHPDGRLSAEFVHLFGPHLYYRSRLYVVEEGGYVKFDEERYLPEEAPGERSVINVRLVDFALEVDRGAIANAQSVVLRGRNEGISPHEIVVVRLPVGATVEAALTGGVPEEQIVFVGQTTLAPGQIDDLVLVNLEPGAYALLCLIDEPDGVPHAAKGEAAQLTIEGTAAPTP